ncbi:MAG: SDR family NAD(P)-dependent oxidoreductase [Pseudolabrys sp.]
MQRVLITAGATGIGREFARAFAKNGARIFTCDIDTAASRRWRANCRVSSRSAAICQNGRRSSAWCRLPSTRSAGSTC